MALLSLPCDHMLAWEKKTFFYNLKGANSKDNSCKGPEDQVIQT